jgi:hypothetical protein
MAWYFYYQVKGGEEAWAPELAESRQIITQTKSPRYTTALDIDRLIASDTPREEVMQAHYRGNFYIDIDVSEEFGGPAKAILQTNKLINNFEDSGVDTRCFKYFASGSKGFHVEIPTQMFAQKPNPRGYQKLPMIYKLMVEDFIVDHVDTSVYSARRGRQFRCVNVKRENERYKVQITLEELRTMTAEQYVEFTAAPRSLFEPRPPVYSSALALSFSKAKDKAETMAKKATKSALKPEELSNWQRKLPPEINRLLTADGILPEVGFQQIAIQLGIVAIGLGWSEAQLQEKATGLVEKHVSDSRRYNSPAKRTRELGRMFDYFSSNGDYYEMALHPIKALLEQRDDEVAPEDGGESEPDDTNGMSMGLKISKNGIFKTLEDQRVVKASSMGLDNITVLVDSATGISVGFSANIYGDGVLKGNYMIPMDTFTSRNLLAKFSAAMAAAPMNITDQQTGGVMWVANQKAMKSGNVKYLANREGVDIIEHLHNPDEDLKEDLVYMSGEASTNCIYSKLDFDYQVRSTGNDSVTPKSDLFRAPPLKCTPQTMEFFDALMVINTPLNMGKLLGWFVACFFKQILQKKWHQFPLLQVFGMAGCGKTRTCELLGRMHYYRKHVEIKQASGMTSHAIKSRMAGSASIPLMLDDLRTNTMSQNEKHTMETFMLGSFNAETMENGTVRKDTGVSYLDTRKYELGAPLAFMGETVNGESRIIARSLVVPMRMGDRGNSAAWNRVYLDQSGVMGCLGWTIAQAVIKGNIESIHESMNKFIQLVSESMTHTGQDADRQQYNVAVALAGLDLFRVVMSHPEVGFNERYTAKIKEMMDAQLDPANEAIVKDMDDTSRVLNVMAFLTKEEQPEMYRMSLGVDYTVQETTVDIKLQNAFSKFLIYNRAIGTRPWVSDYTRFLAAMRNYSGVVDRFCLDNRVLKDSPGADVFRLNRDLLQRYGVDTFRH